MSRDQATPAPPFHRALLAPRHWPAWLGVAAFSLLLLVPVWLRDRMAARVGDLQFHTNRKRRGIVEINLAQCFPDRDAAARHAMARAHFRAYAQIMADQATMWWDWRRTMAERRCDLHGLEIARSIEAEGGHVILLNAHTIAIDFGGIALSRYLPLAAIVNPPRNPVLDWIVLRVRARYDAALFTREAGLRPVVRALRHGRCLYYSPDEDLGTRDSVFAPFFGQPKATLATLGRLAQLLRARVVPVYTWYDAASGRYQVHLRPPLEDFPGDDPVDDAARMNAELERSIALCPSQYLWNYRMFRTRPDGSRLEYPHHRGWRKRLRRRRKQREQARR